MTDTQRAIASVRGDVGTLVVKCDGGDPRLYVEVISDAWLGAKQVDDISVRMDSGPVRMTKAVYFGRSAVITLKGPKPNAQDIISEIEAASKLAVRMSGYGGGPVVSFDITGSKDAIAKVREICQGSLAPEPKR